MRFDACAEFAYGQRKRHWLAQHCWADRPAEISCELFGHVTDLTVQRVISALDRAPGAPVTLTIQSSGGSPVAAFTLFERLRAHAAPVTTMVQGRCFSAAVMVALAGDSRSCAPSATYMLHNVSLELGWSTARSCRAGADILDEMDQAFYAVVASRAGFYPRWQLAQDMSGERILDSEAARLRGLTHVIVD